MKAIPYPPPFARVLVKTQIRTILEPTFPILATIENQNRLRGLPVKRSVLVMAAPGVRAYRMGKSGPEPALSCGEDGAYHPAGDDHLEPLEGDGAGAFLEQLQLQADEGLIRHSLRQVNAAQAVAAVPRYRESSSITARALHPARASPGGPRHY
jgi:hypothetical protein